jgi:hypothetical protein
MRTDESRGAFAEVVAESPPAIAEVARLLREMIDSVDADIVEQPRPAENHARYGIGSGKAGELFGYICPLRDYVRLGFYFGAALPDPDGLLVGEGKRLRHVKIYTIDEAERPAVGRLLEAAVAERKAAS